MDLPRLWQPRRAPRPALQPRKVSVPRPSNPSPTPNPFKLGSLGFLTPFDPSEIDKRLGQVTEGGFPMILRHRLHCVIMRASQGGTLTNRPPYLNPDMTLIHLKVEPTYY